jgi:putative addiction module component (TIGR02574 family)
MNAAISAEIAHLTPAEKLSFIGELWDGLSAGGGDIPIPEWHKDVLAEDQARYGANPAEGSSWEEVRARITEKS